MNALVSFTHLFIHETGTKCLLCVRFWAVCWGHQRDSLCYQGASNQLERQIHKKLIIIKCSYSKELEKEMATHSSVLAWRIPGTGEPGGLPSLGSHRIGHD